jgi:AAHS family 4-hydroxybenzoate transporter-like MFS transporter
MDRTPPIDVAAFIETRLLTGYLRRVPILCVLLMLVEGIDAFGIGFVGPFLGKALDLTPERLGTIYTATVIASLIGAAVLAPLSDRIGRRPMLLWTTAIMVPATVATALAPNFAALLVARFLIGVAFGAAFPVAIALVADYAPAARRSMLLMMLNAGIGGGVVIAGYAAAIVIPTLGWQAFLYLSAGVSALVGLLAWALLPESLPLLVRSGRQAEALAIARRIAPEDTPAALAWHQPEGTGATTPLALFERRTWLTTMLLWAMVSFTYVTINFVSYWLPTAMMAAGLSIGKAGVAISTGKLCGLAGIFAIGWLADRFGLTRVMTVNFALTGMLILAIAGVPAGGVAIALLIAALSVDGANASGGHALMATSYPSQLRATAFGWISGFARLIGGGAGAMLGAHLVGANWSIAAMALLFAATFAANAAIVAAIARRG